MTPFMDDDFLLQTETARTLYHTFAQPQPIIDYHCHIDPAEIAEDRCFTDIAQAWLGGDHYKWRLMRSNGVDERLITGDAPGREKFQAFAEALPRAIGNPIYHWAHLELRRYFGYDGVLDGGTAGEVWALCQKKLPALSVREIIRRSNVEVIVTTDDPADSLDAHRHIREDAACPARVLPGWRPDQAMNLTKPGWREYIGRLGEAAGVSVTDLDSLKDALSRRMDYFAALGCTVSDHGMEFVPFAPGRKDAAESALKALLRDGAPPAPGDAEACRFELLCFLGAEYARRGWVMQLHTGVLRNANSRRLADLGPDTGFDCIGTGGIPEKTARFLDALVRVDQLPKTILYSIDPNDNAMLGTLIGCFQCGYPGKLQHGAAWWFNDTKRGIEEQLQNLADLSLLGNFVGMLTDSRSFLSYTRHEYFRRILCNLLGNWAETGETPADPALLGGLVEDISHHNAKRYFGF